MAHRRYLVCEGCSGDILRHDDYLELKYGVFYHYRCRPNE